MTMTNGRTLLAMLQHGDSFFPSGAVSFSWGIEALGADGKIVKAADVERFVAHQLRGRWASSDRPVLCAAHAAGGDLECVFAADQLMEANSLAYEQREGSKRMGAALLNIHGRLGTSGAKDYQARVRAGEAPGHVAVIQGLLWRALGLDMDSACHMAAHGLSVGLLGAALRLGLIGHVDSQAILGRLHKSMDEILRTAPPPLGELHAYAPAADIAMMRHETQDSRLFSN
jgi:urease accessory protein